MGLSARNRMILMPVLLAALLGASMAWTVYRGTGSAGLGLLSLLGLVGLIWLVSWVAASRFPTDKDD